MEKHFGLWDTTIWISQSPRDFEGERLLGSIEWIKRYLRGSVGVLIKACDGRLGWTEQRPWGPWRAETVGELRRSGIGVGLWTFNYGHGPTTEAGYNDWHSPLDELWALESALHVAEPDAVVLNIELAALQSSNPAGDVATLVAGARELHYNVGVSTVWSWGPAHGWPFAAALDAGVQFWSNQWYGADWFDAARYRHYHQSLGGGVPEWISVNPAGGWELVNQVMLTASAGVAWWEWEQVRHSVDLVAAIAARLDQQRGGFNVLPGIDAAMREANDAPAGHEVELRPGYTIAPGRDHLYIWSQESDTVYRLPKS